MKKLEMRYKKQIKGMPGQEKMVLEYYQKKIQVHHKV